MVRDKPLIAGHTGLLFAGTPGVVPDNARYNDVYAATFRSLTTSAYEYDQALRVGRAIEKLG